MSEAVVFIGILTELIDKLLVINNSSGKKVNEMQSMQVRGKKIAFRNLQNGIIIATSQVLLQKHLRAVGVMSATGNVMTAH